MPGRPSRVHRERARARGEARERARERAGSNRSGGRSVSGAGAVSPGDRSVASSLRFCAAGFPCRGLTLREVLFKRPTRRRAFGRRSTMSGSREEERRKLADIINHWNANRLDLFEISRPTEVGRHRKEAGEAVDRPRPLLGGPWRCYRSTLDLKNDGRRSYCGQRGLVGVESPTLPLGEGVPNSIEKCGHLQCHHPPYSQSGDMKWINKLCDD